MPRFARSAAALVACSLALAGCTAQQDTPDLGYVPGDGSITELAPSEREQPVSFSGESAEGDEIDLTRLRGDVVVLNLWYAACGPCRKEAPDLVSVASEMEPEGVEFVGINTRDDAATAQSFQRTFDIPYPSLLDASGQAVLALRGKVSPNAVPTTLVLDKEGRVAARVVGIVEEATLRAMVKTVVAET